VRLDQLEKESEQHQAVVDALNRKYTDAIEKLQNDKALLEVRDTFTCWKPIVFISRAAQVITRNDHVHLVSKAVL